MNKRYVYIVKGTTGECSDRNEWSITAFEEPSSAGALVRALNQTARSLGLWYEGQVTASFRERNSASYLQPLTLIHNKAAFRCIDYTGVKYFLEVLEVQGKE